MNRSDAAGGLVGYQYGNAVSGSDAAGEVFRASHHRVTLGEQQLTLSLGAAQLHYLVAMHLSEKEYPRGLDTEELCRPSKVLIHVFWRVSNSIREVETSIGAFTNSASTREECVAKAVLR